MKKLLPSVFGLFLLSVLALQASIATADPAVNRLLASQCAQCHGTNGYSRSEFDGIAGEEARDLVEDLTDMKEEDRPENIMDHQALGYSDEQILRIAAYYASLSDDDPNASGDASEKDLEQVERVTQHEEQKTYEVEEEDEDEDEEHDEAEEDEVDEEDEEDDED